MSHNQALVSQTFLEATTAISSSSTPLVHDVIHWIDVMTKHLEDTHDNVEKLPIVRAAAHKGYKILQKYYQHSDETPFYRIVMRASLLFFIFGSMLILASQSFTCATKSNISLMHGGPCRGSRSPSTCFILSGRSDTETLRTAGKTPKGIANKLMATPYTTARNQHLSLTLLQCVAGCSFCAWY